MSIPKFTKTHNLVVFLDKSKESKGFEQIIDFLNASSIRYALTVNLTIYTSCIKQFWATAKVQTINEEVQIQALVDGKKVIVTETSVRRALHLKDAKGTYCLPTATIFAELERMGFVQVFLDKQVEDMTKHKEIYVTPSHTKKIFANMKREGKGFSSRITPLYQTMMVQAPEEVGEGSAVPTDSHYTTTQPSTSRPQKKQSKRKQRKDSGPTEPVTNEATNKEHVSTPSYVPSQSGKDRMQINELIDLCAKLTDRVLALENSNTSQAAEIATLKERVKKLEKKKRSKTYKPRRLYKGRKIAYLHADTEVTLIDETQRRNDEDLMFDTSVLNGDEVFQEHIVNTNTTTKSSIPVSFVDPVTTSGKVVTTASVEIPEELTLAQTLIEIKSAKPKAVTTTATTVTPDSSRPKAKGIFFHDQAPTSTPIVSLSQLPQAKDKGKAKMVEPEKPLKKKDQIAIDEEVARNLEA
ncbi:hypothetical protein Tco_1017751 [Tanacetum coccineum]|uniref:Xylulose kinase-1 n=1 Tax=Tanacetum coccineum TaxID=301880 RepID=A0ABQ5FSG3_9ASTR